MAKKSKKDKWKNRLKKFMRKHGLEPSDDIHICAHRINEKGVSIINNVDGRNFGSLKVELCGIVKRDRDGCDISQGVTGTGAVKAKKKSDNFYKSWEWKKLRFEVLKYYGAKCMLCGAENRIVVDHIYPRKKFPHLEMEFSNMQVLCQDCNQGKSNDDYTDFRPKEDIDIFLDRLDKWKDSG